MEISQSHLTTAVCKWCINVAGICDPATLKKLNTIYMYVEPIHYEIKPSALLFQKHFNITLLVLSIIWHKIINTVK